MNPRVRTLIIQAARRHNIDPEAALAVAMGEGGVKWGAVGDGGTSFGPFQLHVGGALPKGKDAAWANSAAGVDYALRTMAQSGAAGLTGNAAVDTIIRKFERPADPDSSVANALKRYGTFNVKGGGGLPATAAPGQPFKLPPPPGPDAFKTVVANQMMASAANLVKTGQAPAVNSTMELAQTRQQMEAAGMFRQQDKLAGKVPDSPFPEEALAPGKNGTGLNASAARYLGVPYTWGGNDAKSGMDCSGFVIKIFQENGVDLSQYGRTTYHLVKAGQEVKPDKMQAGDVVYWDWGGDGGPDHMGMYMGNGKYVMASGKRGEVRGNSGGKVKVVGVNDYAKPTAIRRYK